MENKAVFLVINSVPNTDEMEQLKLYSKEIVKVFSAFEGKIVHRYKTVEHLMGNGTIKNVVIVEFPSAEKVKSMRESEAFNALNDLRKKAFKQDVDLMLCESM